MDTKRAHFFLKTLLILKSMSQRDSEILETFGGQLKKFRKVKGFSQRDLAYHAGISHGKIGQMERGEINITILTLVKLAEALETDPAVFVSRKVLKV